MQITINPSVPLPQLPGPSSAEDTSGAFAAVVAALANLAHPVAAPTHPAQMAERDAEDPAAQQESVSENQMPGKVSQRNWPQGAAPDGVSRQDDLDLPTAPQKQEVSLDRSDAPGRIAVVGSPATDIPLASSEPNRSEIPTTSAAPLPIADPLGSDAAIEIEAAAPVDSPFLASQATSLSNPLPSRPVTAPHVGTNTPQTASDAIFSGISSEQKAASEFSRPPPQNVAVPAQSEGATNVWFPSPSVSPSSSVPPTASIVPAKLGKTLSPPVATGALASGSDVSPPRMLPEAHTRTGSSPFPTTPPLTQVAVPQRQSPAPMIAPLAPAPGLAPSNLPQSVLPQQSATAPTPQVDFRPPEHVAKASNGGRLTDVPHFSPIQEGDLVTKALPPPAPQASEIKVVIAKALHTDPVVFASTATHHAPVMQVPTGTVGRQPVRISPVKPDPDRPSLPPSPTESVPQDRARVFASAAPAFASVVHLFPLPQPAVQPVLGPIPHLPDKFWPSQGAGQSALGQQGVDGVGVQSLPSSAPVIEGPIALHAINQLAAAKPPQAAGTPSPAPSHLPVQSLPGADLKDSVAEWHGVARDASVPSTSSAVPMSPPATVVPGPAFAQQLAHAIVQSVGAGRDGALELSLRPDELGHLRFDISTSGDKLSVIVFVERPEAMELFRRHAEHLLNELRIAGFAQPSLSFGEWSQRNARSATPQPDTGSALPAESAVEPFSLPSASQKTAATGRLDLRL